MAPTETTVLPPRYRDARRIGRGAMGEVYRATDSSLGRVVAIKVLSEAYVGDEDARRRFAREARAAARVSDDRNIVTIYDVGEIEDRPYIVMEYMPGGSLEDRLHAEGAQPAAAALRWLAQTASALDHAHTRGVVHRDVKPGNLLLDGADNVHVADFGIASAAGMASLTVTGTILGTTGYLSPEQARGERATDASDRYGLAVVAYELLSGERPFAGGSAAAEAAAHAHAPVPSISARTQLPPRLDAVFARGLAKDPAARYPTCAALVAALRAELERKPVAEPATLPLAASATTVRQAPPAVVRRPTPRWPLVLAALVALGVLGVVLAVVAGGGSKNDGARQAARTHAARTHRKPKPVHKAATTTAATAPTTSAATTTAATTQSTPTQSVTPVAEGPHSLNDRAWDLMKQGRYTEALPLLQQAVPALSGAGPADPYEAYANYNLGYTLLQLGQCSQATPYLEHARQLEPDRKEVRDALEAAKHCGEPGKKKPH